LGLLNSFTNQDGKIYSIIYSPEGENTNYNIEHKGDSQFEVITPAVIAGVEGTKFNVNSKWENLIATTVITVEEGIISARERNQGREEKVGAGEEITVETKTYKEAKKDRVPRKPPKQQPHIIKKGKK
jgi:hypothetical protein